MSLELAVVIPSLNDGPWLSALLPTLAPALGDVASEIVVADIGSTDETAAVVDEWPGARRVPVENRGFAAVNNQAWLTCDAHFALFLNADTEILEGSIATLLEEMHADPSIGLLCVKQLRPDGQLDRTMRRAPGVRRALAEALLTERGSGGRGERILDPRAYDAHTGCAWTVGSFMLVRRDALLAAGLMDERFFFTAEERDLCERIRQAGWRIAHSPSMTILHHTGKRGPDPRFFAQTVYAELQYAAKHFGPVRRRAYRAALALNYGLRFAASGINPGGDPALGAARRAALLMAVRGGPPPFGEPPATALTRTPAEPSALAQTSR